MSQARDLKILVVDDSKMNQILISAQIKKTLANIDSITIAEDGQVAVEMCTDKAFDLIFMDFNMPKMNGAEATLLIRAGSLNSFDKCIILTCSATTSNEPGYQGVYPGANFRLEKPIQPDELKSILLSCGLQLIEAEINSVVENNDNYLHRRKYSSDFMFQPKPDVNVELDTDLHANQSNNCCNRNCDIL